MIRSRRDVPNAPCSNCRKKHLKCDWNARFESGAGPAMTCRRCSVVGEECIQGLNVRFKRSPDEYQEFYNLTALEKYLVRNLVTLSGSALIRTSPGSDARERVRTVFRKLT
ncbi:hypothetical protein MY1884_007919 [Beauveria asiatica]